MNKVREYAVEVEARAPVHAPSGVRMANGGDARMWARNVEIADLFVNGHPIYGWKQIVEARVAERQRQVAESHPDWLAYAHRVPSGRGGSIRTYEDEWVGYCPTCGQKEMEHPDRASLCPDCG